MMGARVTRVFTNFNLESRAHREIGKAKPAPAPRHPTAPAAARDQSAEFQEEVKKKDEHLLTLLKDVYVDSKDPSKQVNKGGRLPSKPEERRLANVGHLSQLDVQTVPKGKISVVEALTILSAHQRSPQTWTAEKIAKEYFLELKDVTALLTFFIPFAVEIFTHKDKTPLKPR